MATIEFNNGSKITPIKSNSVVRGRGYATFKNQLKELADQERALIELMTVLNENMEKYKNLPKQQLNIMKRYVTQGYSSDYAFNKSQIYIKRFKKLSQETILSHSEAGYVCDLFEDKRYADILFYLAGNPYLFNTIQEVIEEEKISI